MVLWNSSNNRTIGFSHQALTISKYLEWKIEMRNEYLDKIDADENIKEFNRLWNKANDLSKNIVDRNGTILLIFQAMFKDIIRDNRILCATKTKKTNWGYTYNESLGLGTNGIGISENTARIDYRDGYILEHRQDILDNADLFRNGIKSSTLEQFNKAIKALELYTIPSNANSIKEHYYLDYQFSLDRTVDCSSIKGAYIIGDVRLINTIEVKCCIIDNRFSLSGFKKEDKNHYSDVIYPTQLSDIIHYHHLIPDFIAILNDFIVILNNEIKRLDAFINTPEFQAIYEIKKDKEMIENL